ncbi:CDP-diacylglycerol--serine O-phosphatidyltransferase [Alsobacter sp. KACC 23698]|uniref:CDP-diacylglycerol--serine O-phosphatidyltransferase n=1 Tax=Alsobacter sp. KACC 23698 TaxID=3149229 RepID=A0AAU7JI80_9HYPH
MTDLFPPYEPGDEPRRRRFKPVPLRVLLPNLVTLLSLCAGLTAMRLAIEGDDKLDRAVIAILIAAVLDGLDGRLARLLKGTSRFGAELDSLADFVSFGVAPAIILYTYSLHVLPSLGWLVTLAFAMACALRLARFNVSIDDPMRPDWQKNFFVGIPAPAGALAGLLPVYIHLVGVERPAGFVVLEAVYVLFIALMMVSRIPTYAGKTLGSRVPREWAIPLLLAVALFITLLVIHTFALLLVLTVIYLGLIPLGVRKYRVRERLDRRSPAMTPEPANAPGDH